MTAVSVPVRWRPLHAFPSLKAILGFDGHDMAGFHELLEQLGDELLKLGSVALKVTDE